MKIFSNFLLLPLWLRRLLIAGTVIPFLFIGRMRAHYMDDKIAGAVAYWGVILVGCWIYEGFVSQRKRT